MSTNRNKHDPLALPQRWLNCPRKANSLVDKFLAFKVPLSTKFDRNVPSEFKFNMSMLIESVKRTFNAKFGLIIDLTNTNRFYDADSEVKQQGIRHLKLNCKGHGETPSEEHTKLFINCVETFMRQNPTELIGVHCTHGFNRTGFLICSYLVEKLDYSIDMAVRLFADSRPPGIYKQDYLDELYKRYADDPSVPMLTAPPYPTWDNNITTSSIGCLDLNLEDMDSDGNNEDDDLSATSSSSSPSSSNNVNKTNQRGKKRQRNEETKLNPQFADPSITGIEACSNKEEIVTIRSEIQECCEWNGAGFPGAQPVSMYQANIRFLTEKKYMVSWKADGTRYLMYIRGKDEIYMADRDNSIFKVKYLVFPHRKDLNRHLVNTLIDGEFVIDIDPNNQQKIPRFLIYDIIKFENEKVGKTNFNTRLLCIDKELIKPRNEAIKLGKINKNMEPFSVRQKLFYHISDTRKLLSEDFKKQISHGIDGLIFQPVDDPYKGGRCDAILKWKPPTMNSVDFKLIITVREEVGMLPERTGLLYVIGYDQPFSSMKVTKSISGLDNKIIECRWHDNKWDFMRERVDKSYPNHYNTAVAVCESIKNPITEERLIEIVQYIENMNRSGNFAVPHPPQQSQSHQHHPR